ncbi:MAG: hypothetical protein KAW17_13465 [Candidatus Eisenbacteria sp.]|nr:hypothetical protein [Candidatus Eisenbacteria bacterium]
MKEFRRYLLAVGLVAFVAFLVGCGGSSDNVTNPTPTPPDVPEDVTQTPKSANDDAEAAEEPVMLQ